MAKKTWFYEIDVEEGQTPPSFFKVAVPIRVDGTAEQPLMEVTGYRWGSRPDDEEHARTIAEHVARNLVRAGSEILEDFARRAGRE